ncbi:MAG: hypothetical protein HC914_16385 [Chloroflexaceae bacterium]|nr:hypothetical protein [Chloroflexaceae bacterium]
MMQQWIQRYWLRWCGLFLVAGLLVGLYGLHAARSISAGDKADISVTLLSTPNLAVVPGSALTYEIRVKNFGQGAAGRVRVFLPYDPAVLSGFDATFHNEGDWLSAIRPNEVELRFHDVGEDDLHIATIRVKVSEYVPVGTVINTRAVFEWYDGNETTENELTNLAPVLVSVANDHVPQVPLVVGPERGPVGTVYQFSSNRFRPEEIIDVWLNTPAGVVEPALDVRADRLGQVWLQLPSDTLEPGAYSLVMYGTRSAVLSVGAFIVDE